MEENNNDGKKWAKVAGSYGKLRHGGITVRDVSREIKNAAKRNFARNGEKMQRD